MSEQSLVIVQPLAVTDAMLTTDVPENDYAAWSGATPYAQGARVIRVATNFHKVYERLVAGTTATAPELDAVNWIEVSPTNRWKLLDSKNSSRTVHPTGFYYSIVPGTSIGAVHWGDVVDCTSVRVRLTDPTFGVVYDQTINMAGQPMTSDWHSFLLGAWTNGQKAYSLTDLPSFPNATLRVDFAGGTSLGVGILLLGAPYEFGMGVRLGVRTGIQDYSQKTPNQFGDVNFLVGAYAKRVRLAIRLLNTELDILQDFLTDLRATPALYIVYGPISATHVFGAYKNFENVIAYVNVSDCELEIEGLT